MNYRILSIIFFTFFLIGCEQNSFNKNLANQNKLSKYKNSGFTLVYDNILKQEKKISKRIDNRSLFIFHKNLKENSFVKITNPKNQKTIIAEVISNKAKFSDFYNSVITLRIAEEISLDLKEPYIELVLISQNSTFVAKKAKTFKEEKKVAEKAPVDGIQIDNLGETIDPKEEISSFGSMVSPKLSICIPSTGAFSATFFSSLKVLAFFATKVEFCEIRTSSIYGSFKSNEISSAILNVITLL